MLSACGDEVSWLVDARPSIHLSGKSGRRRQQKYRGMLLGGYEPRLCRKIRIQRNSKASPTHLSAPAAVLGPNHCPTSLPRSFPASAIRCTLNGQKGEGESKNHVRICTYVA